jgi:pimeloyl-ACP methyl ester carboxylesterase
VATFCLLHGAWHDSSSWVPLLEALRMRGHDPRAADLPLHEPGGTHAERVQPAIDSVADVDDPVVVVAHSQSASLGPLVAAARPTSLLVYLCPRRLGAVEDAPPDAPRPFRETIPMPQSGDDGTSSWDRDTAVSAMYAHLPEETGRALAEHLHPMAMPADDYPLHSLPDVPAALIYCSEDEFFEPDWERYLAREQLGIEPIELPGGHFPMVEQPERLADVLDGLLPEIAG